MKREIKKISGRTMPAKLASRLAAAFVAQGREHTTTQNGDGTVTVSFVTTIRW